MNFDKQTDILIVVTLNHSFFYSPKKIQIMAKNSPDEGKNIKMVEKQAVEASMINLKEYRAKRQFGKTPEPMADTVETPNRMPVFVVQKHDASHFHFDFRLEVDGVLKVGWYLKALP